VGSYSLASNAAKASPNAVTPDDVNLPLRETSVERTAAGETPNSPTLCFKLDRPELFSNALW
jgi:hypothetical protein